MICSRCGKECKDLFAGCVCHQCYAEMNNEDLSSMHKAMTLNMLKHMMDKPNHPKVQFFEETNLLTIRDQMNKFFESLQKEDIIDIKLFKDTRYIVMVVYV
jgi:hypothetical protein